MKECRDCKYCEVIDTKEPRMDHCYHPNRTYYHCIFERDNLGSCKEEGYLFEEK